MLIPFLTVQLLILTCATAFDAWHLDYLYPLVSERIDPIVNPNNVGGHMHRVVGGNNFGASYSSDDYKAASCSSASIQKDKSNYWMPQLFWMENGTFAPLAATTRFYYFLGRNDDATPVVAFPEGLQILVGNPVAKSYNDPGALQPNAVSFTCQNNHFSIPTNDTSRPDFNFPYDCPQSMKTEIKFPPCWDGVNLFKSDGSHMAYASNTHFGTCPFDHPIRLPGLMLEYVWQTDVYRPGVPLAGNLVWANGDTTGYGIHADFVNGWDNDVLTTALNNPDCLIGEVTMSECPTLAQYMNNYAAQACTPSKGVFTEPGAKDYQPVPSLPGCNTPWASGSKPGCGASTGTPTLPPSLLGTPGPLVVSNGTTGQPLNSTAAVSTTPPAGAYSASQWSPVGCLGKGTADAPTMVNNVPYTDTTLTIPKCQQFCYEGGFAYSGVMSGIYCQCSHSFLASQFTANTCTAKCGGDSTTICGGNGVLSVYYNPTVTTPPVISSDPAYMGCRHEAFGSKTLNLASIIIPKMTIEACKSYCVAQPGANIAGIEYGNTCMCGSSFAGGGGGHWPEAFCNVTCPGNSAQMCGGMLMSISTFNVSIAAGQNLKPSSAPISFPSSSASSTASVNANSTGITSTPTSVAPTSSVCATVTVTVTATVTVTSSSKRSHERFARWN